MTQQQRDEAIAKQIVRLLHENGFTDAAEFLARVLTMGQVLEQLL